MQERPNKLVLLTAIARFLNEEARPALTDPRLAFRALIAANLASIVASELMTDDDFVTAELTRLREIFPDAAASDLPPRVEDRRAIVADLNRRLARAFREGAFDGDAVMMARATEHLRQTLKDKLTVDNPRFDTTMEID